MKALTHEALPAHLKRDKPAHAYLVHGGEELLVDECRSLLCGAIAHDERIVLQPERGAELPALLHTCAANLSLFGEARHIEVLMGSAADARAGKELLQAAEGMRGGEDTLVICMHGLDGRTQKTAWFGALRAACVSVSVPKVGRDALPDWVEERLAKSGHSLTAEAMGLFVEMTEGNLLAASQEILKIGLLFPEGEVDAASLREELVNLSRHNVFALQDTLRAGDAGEMLRVLDSLRDEGAPAPLVLWALADEARALLATREGRKHPGAWGKRLGSLQRAADCASLQELLGHLARAQRADLKVRGLDPEREDPWDEFARLAFKLRRTICRPAMRHPA